MSGHIVNVSTEAQLQTAFSNLQAGDTVVLADGTYNLTSTLYVNGKANVTLRGTSGCDGVVLAGKGMDTPTGGTVDFGVWSNSPNTTVAHLTLRDTWDNEIIFNPGASSPHVYSVKLLNSGSQFIKSNPNGVTPPVGNDNGLVEDSWFEYLATPPTNPAHSGGAGYFNGLSIHAGKNWTIRGNFFRNLHNPDGTSYDWNPSVLIWNFSSGTVTEKNVFVNVDRAVAYGLQQRTGGFDHQGGAVRNNFVTELPGFMSATRTAGSDGAIIVWQSPGTAVDDNTVLTHGNILHAVEFRFPETTGGEAMNILSDADINLRDSAIAAEAGELLTASPSFFVDPASGDLHLVSSATAAIGHGATVASVTDDIDGDPRPAGAYDVGADQYTAGRLDGGSADSGSVGQDAGSAPGDGGTRPDAGSAAGDGGTGSDAGQTPPTVKGCGCAASGGSWMLLGLCGGLALLALRGRRWSPALRRSSFVSRR
jgi:hypothetical protein